MKKILELAKANKVIAGVIVALLVAFIAFNAVKSNKAEAAAAKEKAAIQKEIDDELAALDTTTGSDGTPGVDAVLIQSQSNLNTKNGTAPTGYIWDFDGSLISLGDKSLTSEDAMYSFVRGTSTLDFSTATKFSRGSTVVDTYQGYFNTAGLVDYREQFLKDMYKEALLSIQIKDVEDTAVFAENKVVFSLNVKILDLTNKDFWLDDKDDLFETLYLYDKGESDTTKSEQYLYKYILDYYKSDQSTLQSVTVDFEVQRYPDIDSGWLVSNDIALDALCKYSDGTLVMNYIQDQYNDWKLNKSVEGF